jgi:predicted phosphodiesterase
MRFQLLSDIHLEFYKDGVPNIIPRAPYLILAGDIGYPTMDNFSEFMNQVVGKFTKVFYIPGNHEYYCTRKVEGITKDDVDSMINELESKIGFINLHNKTYVLEGIKLIGCTLWTECTVESYKLLSLTMNDYKWIKKTPSTFISPWDTGSWHYSSVRFLEKELKGDEKKIVITHHLPSMKFVQPKYFNNLANCGFYSNIERLFNTSILAWCAGHTHSKVQSQLNNTQLLVNPLGYPGEIKDPDWEFRFEV